MDILEHISFYSYPLFFTGIGVLALGLFIWLKNRKAKQNIVFLFLGLASAVWQLMYSITYSVHDQETALILLKIGYAGTMFIAALLFHLLFLFLLFFLPVLPFLLLY